jgi:hypothetical protein
MKGGRKVQAPSPCIHRRNGESQVLRNGLVEYAERMWKVYAPVSRDDVSRRNPPSGTGEVAEAVNRNDGRLIKRANMKCGGEVREMMFN